MEKKVSIIKDNNKIRLKFSFENKQIAISTGINTGIFSLGFIEALKNQIQYDINNNSLKDLEIYKQICKIYSKFSLGGFFEPSIFPTRASIFKFLWFTYAKRGFTGIDLNEEFKLKDNFITEALAIFKNDSAILDKVEFIKSYKESEGLNIVEKEEAETKKDYSEQFKVWAVEVKHASEFNGHYTNVYNYLKKKGKIKIEDLPKLLNSEKQWSNLTYNRMKLYLDNFCKYLVKKKEISENPLEDSDNKKVQKKVKEERKPLTKEEVNVILEALKNNTYTNKYSPIKDSFYYPFAAFMAYTGTRPQEAAALIVSDIKENYLVINKAVGMKRGLETHNTRIKEVKNTKNNKERNLPLNKDLKELLLKQIEEKKQNDLVFTNSIGNFFDYDNFQKRILPKIWENTGIAKRDIYCFRHSYASHLVESGLSFTKVAAILGDTIRVIQENYAHLIKEIDELPIVY